MRQRVGFFTIVAVPLALAAMMLPGAGTNDLFAQAPGMAPAEKEVQVVIRDREKGYEVTGASMAGVLTKITVRNMDTVTHGFTSRLFKEVPVKMEGQGQEVTGKKIKTFHLDPGQAMTLTFEKADTFNIYGEGEVQFIGFWCDIHPHVKGELLLVPTSSAGGG